MTESSSSKLTVTWRAYAAGMLAVLAFFAVRIYDKVDHTADAVLALNGRMDAQAERLADHDRRIGRLEGPFFSGFKPGQNP